jgi:hypothetical protein
MKTVQNKQTGKYGLLCDPLEANSSLYFELLCSIRYSEEGSFNIPHIKLLLDVQNAKSEMALKDEIAVIFLDETGDGHSEEWLSREEFNHFYVTTESRFSAKMWKNNLNHNYEIKNLWYGERQLDLMEYWLSYFWDKRELGSNEKDNG